MKYDAEKKQKLWLHRPKPYHRRNNIGRAYGDKFGLLRWARGIKGTYRIVHTLISSKKNYSTPAKTRTPTRKKLSLVITPRSDIFSPPHNVVEVGKHVEISPTSNVQSPEQILLDSEDTEEDCVVQVFKKFISKFSKTVSFLSNISFQMCHLWKIIGRFPWRVRIPSFQAKMFHHWHFSWIVESHRSLASQFTDELFGFFSASYFKNPEID